MAIENLRKHEFCNFFSFFFFTTKPVSATLPDYSVSKITPRVFKNLSSYFRNFTVVYCTSRFGLETGTTCSFKCKFTLVQFLWPSWKSDGNFSFKQFSTRSVDISLLFFFFLQFEFLGWFYREHFSVQSKKIRCIVLHWLPTKPGCGMRPFQSGKNSAYYFSIQKLLFKKKKKILSTTKPGMKFYPLKVFLWHSTLFFACVSVLPFQYGAMSGC